MRKCSLHIKSSNSGADVPPSSTQLNTFCSVGRFFIGFTHKVLLKTPNEQVLCRISVGLLRTISHKYRYVANHITMFFSNDNYYLVCYHDNHKTLTNYRIDSMTEVGILDTPINKDKRPQNIGLSDYHKQVFSMFSGEQARVTFEATTDLIDVILDKFGEKTLITDCGNNTMRFTVEIQLSKSARFVFLHLYCDYSYLIRGAF